MSVPYEVAPPKYARVVIELQRRIADGTYPPGEALPSENQLVREFGVSRPTVVRALHILRTDGWIESQQGRGHFVRGLPAVAGRRPPEHLSALLDADESVSVDLVAVGPLLVSGRIASVLGVADGAPAIRRRRVASAEEGPVELTSTYFPLDITAGTDLGKAEPIPGGLRRYLEAAKGVRFDHATERVSARLADRDEVALLGLGRREPVLNLLVSAHDPAGAVLVVIDLVLPAALHELEDSYQLA